MNISKPTPFLFFSFLYIALTALLFLLVIPVYQGPDEQIHYATIQYRAEPQEKNWDITTSTQYQTGQTLDRYHLSPEVIAGGIATQFDDIKWREENTQKFSPGIFGPEEEMLMQKELSRVIAVYPVHASPNISWYYTATTHLEQTLSTHHWHFLDKFFAMRFVSFLCYLISVLFFFQIARKIFSSPLQSTLFILFVALQPMLLFIGTIVNIDIALILGGALFFWGALEALTRPRKVFSHFLLLSGLLVAFFGKAPGIAFVPVAFGIYGYLLFLRYPHSWRRILLYAPLGFFSLLTLAVFTLPDSLIQTFLNFGQKSAFPNTFISLQSYAKATLDTDALLSTHASYWGNFGWLDTTVHKPILFIFLLLEAIGWTGAFWYLVSPRHKDYLPQKAFLWGAFAMIAFLQFAIRFYDWRVFDSVGQVVIGSPGRYFLPTLFPHLLIILTGLGVIFTKNAREFSRLTAFCAIGMMLYSLYALFLIILPRYYF